MRNEAILQRFRTFYIKLSTNNLIQFLADKKENISFILTSSEEQNKNIYNIKTVLGLLIGYFTKSKYEPINIKDNTEQSNTDMMPEMFLHHIISKVNQ